MVIHIIYFKYKVKTPRPIVFNFIVIKYWKQFSKKKHFLKLSILCVFIKIVPDARNYWTNYSYWRESDFNVIWKDSKWLMKIKKTQKIFKETKWTSVLWLQVSWRYNYNEMFGVESKSLFLELVQKWFEEFDIANRCIFVNRIYNI